MALFRAPMRVGSPVRGQGAELRASAWAERSSRILAKLFNTLDRELPRLLGKSKLAEAIRYPLSPDALRAL